MATTDQAPISEFADLDRAVAEVREFGGAESLAAVARWLRVLEQHGMRSLLSVTPAELTYKQGAIRQLAALREVIEGTSLDDGRIA